MTTYEEILKDINIRLESNQDGEKLAMIKSAVEKCIPREAEYISETFQICPRCGDSLTRTPFTRNCDVCGQAIVFKEGSK